VLNTQLQRRSPHTISTNIETLGYIYGGDLTIKTTFPWPTVTS